VRHDDRLKQAFGGSADFVFAGMSPLQSWSGHERDHLFMNEGGTFSDISGISGLDSPLDGRAFATLDYDHDGFADLAVVNSNAPLLQLYRNRIGDLQKARASGAAARAIAVRFVGGNRSDAPSSGTSNRDGYGAAVLARVGDRTIVREHRCGEGLGSQNSATMLVGVGTAAAVDVLTVRWPSGKTHEVRGVPAGTLVTAYEAPEAAPDGKPFTLGDLGPSTAATPAAAQDGQGRRFETALAGAQPARLQVFTTMATWCEACKAELPQVALLRSSFGPNDVALYGVPVDDEDDGAKLEAYAKSQNPAYRLLTDAPEALRRELHKLLQAELPSDTLPATVVVDGERRVLLVGPGVPTVSEIRRLAPLARR
jgi:thiol-disulfide isomerase/thioredoxin